MKKSLLLSVFLCMTAASAFAGHVDTYGIGSKATAMGGAVVAGIDDPFAVYYNPAAMVKIKRPTLSLGTHMVNPGLTIKEYDIHNSNPTALPLADGDINATDINDKSSLLIIPHFGYVTPTSDRGAFGIAFYVPYGLDLKWNSDENENPAAYNTYHSWYTREVLTPAVAYRVTDKLSLGAGVSFGKSTAGNERKRYVPEGMKNSAYMTAVVNSMAAQNGISITAEQASALGSQLAAAYTELDGTSIKMDYEDRFNVSFSLGALYDFNEKWSAGITYRSYSNVNLKGDATTDPSDLEYWHNEDVESDTAVDTPDSVQFGVQYKITPKWSIEADAVRTFWSRIDHYTVSLDDYLLQSAVAPTFVQGANSEYFSRKWRDTWQYRVGTEYKMNDAVALRAGYYYDQSVVPEDTFDVLWPDSNKHVFSGGVGVNFGNYTIDTVFQYIKIEEVKIHSGASANLDDSYTREGLHDADVTAIAGGHIWSLGVTVSYKF